eukprot:2316241-Rhodomonas_salina.3
MTCVPLTKVDPKPATRETISTSTLLRPDPAVTDTSVAEKAGRSCTVTVISVPPETKPSSGEIDKLEVHDTTLVRRATQRDEIACRDILDTQRHSLSRVAALVDLEQLAPWRDERWRNERNSGSIAVEAFARRTRRDVGDAHNLGARCANERVQV